jgi:hypothetical protein
VLGSAYYNIVGGYGTYNLSAGQLSVAAMATVPIVSAAMHSLAAAASTSERVPLSSPAAPTPFPISPIQARTVDVEAKLTAPGSSPWMGWSAL